MLVTFGAVDSDDKHESYIYRNANEYGAVDCDDNH